MPPASSRSANSASPANTSTRLLGIDPGLRITGFGVIDKTGSKLTYVASGCIRTDEKTSLPERLGVITRGIAEIVATYTPVQASIEEVFLNKNPWSTLLLGQARGAAIGALVGAGLPVAEYGTMQIKQAVVGHGRATKAQVQHMVCRLLSLPGEPSQDAADALACAIAHAHGGQGLGALSSAGRRKSGRLTSIPHLKS
ncbi:MAG: crossover junction endodeoxyribonuclease RuvC [Pseudomonadota bacterium]|nr:crossover junction endodeoxyribonuclease RuvC [Pseudomonadota bacterium]MDQ5881886.1 crossover junction endodeoxyribonuclease RuvC [Pseudomonadota bacterium]MDQ5903192.1 crossover junction endodeoxyribonuclease RuvC [Pseudomonadota bacterium]MDQ5906691.1 crossover junction endodeoxyribonuclease RuvC [Pseudomonadota bacterium]MDQ5914848.1 crossover junction endodeoxyribonuclease RuvC [Pseudomonadota bacterium]